MLDPALPAALWPADAASSDSTSEPDRVAERHEALERFAGVRRGVRTVVAPYRVCPLGAHVDHQFGPVLGLAIDLGTRLAFAPGAGTEVRLESADFAGEVRFDLRETGLGDGWGRYARSAVAVLRDRLPPRPRGLVGSISGDLPGGGLSSSASVLVAYLMAIAAVNDVEIARDDLVRLARRAENEFVGVHSGSLDPACVVGAVSEHILEIDTRTIRWRAIAAAEAAVEIRVLVVSSGRSRVLSSTPFNQRVAECRDAAARIARSQGLGPVDALGDLPEDALERGLPDLPPDERGRARHFLEERRRVRAGVGAWSRGHFREFGRLMFDSCRSSIENYQTGSVEQLELQRILRDTPGVLGSRFSGAGYGGCNVAIVESTRAESVRDRVLSEYRAIVPAHAETARALLVSSRDGAHLV